MTFQRLKRVAKLAGITAIDDGRNDPHGHYEGNGQYLESREYNSDSSCQLHTVAVDKD